MPALKPNDQRNFVHKRIIGGIVGGITGGPGGIIPGIIGGGGGGGGLTVGSPGLAPPRGGQRRSDITRHSKLGGHAFARYPGHVPHGPGSVTTQQGNIAPRRDACLPGLFEDIDGVCRFPSSPADISVGGAMGGVAVMGRYGAAMAPETEERLHRTCLPGMVLGDDSLCYNRRDLKNSERKYPKGRRPLLTGGDRNAITRAARAARAIQRTEKQLRKLGMLKTPAPRRAKAKPQMLQLPPGSPSIINVE